MPLGFDNFNPNDFSLTEAGLIFGMIITYMPLVRAFVGQENKKRNGSRDCNIFMNYPFKISNL